MANSTLQGFTFRRRGTCEDDEFYLQVFEYCRRYKAMHYDCYSLKTTLNSNGTYSASESVRYNHHDLEELQSIIIGLVHLDVQITVHSDDYCSDEQYSSTVDGLVHEISPEEELDQLSELWD